MRSIVVLALCAALLAPALHGQAAGAAGAGRAKPKAVVPEPITDAGTVAKGDKLTHDFEIRNDGDADLQILEVRPSCGCTVASFDKVIPPHKSGKVHVVVDTQTFNGGVEKGITVQTNDPANPFIDLGVKVRVEPYIAARPGYARYITVQGEKQEGTIVQTLWAPDGAPMDILKVDSPWPYLTVSFREAQEGERLPDVKTRQWRVEMLLSNEAPVGPLAGYVYVHTNHLKQKMVEIPVSGFVRPVIAVTPPVGDFGRIELKEPLRKVLNVRSFSTEPIKVLNVDSDGKGIEAKIEPLEEGRQYQVRVTLNPEIGKGPFHGKLTIHTDSPKQPVLEVELKGTVL